MIINIKTNRTIEEIENILSCQILEKYPKKYREYRFGINWVSNKKNLLCLFYEDGTIGNSGYQTTIKPFFYGRLIKVKDNYRIVGICCMNIINLIEIFLCYILFILAADEYDIEWLLGGIFVVFVLAMFFKNIGNGNREIKKYLISKFG